MNTPILEERYGAMVWINPDTQVYCTRCLWFRIIDDAPECKYQYECDIWNCEDSTRYSLRPKYVEKFDQCGVNSK